MNDKILVIDDSADIRELMTVLFESEGYEVSVAENGLRGLLKLKEDTPNLIFLDHQMEGMDGLQFLVEMKRAYPEHSIPVLFLTGTEKADAALVGLDVTKILTKPIDIKELISLAKEFRN